MFGFTFKPSSSHLDAWYLSELVNLHLIVMHAYDSCVYSFASCLTSSQSFFTRDVFIFSSFGYCWPSTFFVRKNIAYNRKHQCLNDVHRLTIVRVKQMFRFHGKSSIKDEVLINLLISHLPTTTASHRVSTESVCSALSLYLEESGRTVVPGDSLARRFCCTQV